MDHQPLVCNAKNCRVELRDKAIVTVYTSLTLDSHTVCFQCARNSGINGPGPYTCPVCRQPLTSGGVLEQKLQPSEEWKNMILCGLSPIDIMECAGRALSFWSYQMNNQVLVSSTHP
ncbi:hypothetical protein QBC47DRAFT_299705 [Echria macrotheca]|uniref:RING-type domain-containing protein n=1 Tax=Echria macrotheca TaxID=438768 RepID=A0AAJ0BEV8_9PEZI|nr:hypothetical protein QBC47DRAFT_299705 [Echria macrotheca]